MGGKKYTVIFSADKTWFSVPEVSPTPVGVWLSVEKKAAPVPEGFKRPAAWGAAVMPGRSYWRDFTFGRQVQGVSEMRIADDELVADYREASWWTPGISEPVAAPAPKAPESKKAGKPESQKAGKPESQTDEQKMAPAAPTESKKAVK